jgi:hypothetical protein
VGERLDLSALAASFLWVDETRTGFLSSGIALSASRWTIRGAFACGKRVLSQCGIRAVFDGVADFDQATFDA